jgi:hypothetical protein
MDSGLMEQDAFENYDVLAPRLPEEIIGILDQLLSHEVCTILHWTESEWDG